MRIALVGNQNCGKTTLFNQLTGSNQHTGNYPGITVDIKSGEIKGNDDIILTDLPGMYSLNPYTNEEKITYNYLTNEKPDGIINIIDSTNLERNLYLTLQLIELGIPLIAALNMTDELKADGGSIKTREFETELGIFAISISAKKNEGTDELVSKLLQTVKNNIHPAKNNFYSGAPHRCVQNITQLIKTDKKYIGYKKTNEVFSAIKIIEGDQYYIKNHGFDDDFIKTAKNYIIEIEKEYGETAEELIIEARYKYIEKFCAKVYIKPKLNKEKKRSAAADKILTGKYTAIPIFIIIMLAMFYFTFGVSGPVLNNLLSLVLNNISLAAETFLSGIGVNEILRDLLLNGIFSGIGSVLSFIPYIAVLFILLSFLEDSGYMARIVYIMDKPLTKLGLSGKSIVPLLIGFGCSVPAVMAARTIPGDRDRKMTVLLIPFMSCSAKLPIYTLFTVLFFSKTAPVVMILLYAGSIISGIIYSKILKHTIKSNNSAPFLMELPNYRLPSLKSVAKLVLDKLKHFINRAFTVIFLASLIIWIMRTFDFNFNVVSNSSESMLSVLGSKSAIIFAPLGFGNYIAVTALISGFFAKEAVVSTFAVLTGSIGAGGYENLFFALKEMFTSQEAISFLTFVLLYTPCVAAVAAVKREIGLKWSVFMVVMQICIAWTASFIVYNLVKIILYIF